MTRVILHESEYITKQLTVSVVPENCTSIMKMTGLYLGQGTDILPMIFCVPPDHPNKFQAVL